MGSVVSRKGAKNRKDRQGFSQNPQSSQQQSPFSELNCYGNNDRASKKITAK
jgi:hypothetical protein